MRPHVRCPRGSHKNRAGQCISTTPRRRIIRDVLHPSLPSPPSPPYPPSPLSTVSPHSLPSPPYPPSPPSFSPVSPIFASSPSPSIPSHQSYFSVSSSSPESPMINMMNEDKNEAILYEDKNERQVRRKCPRGSRRDRRSGECRTTTARRRVVAEPPPMIVVPRVRLPRTVNNPPAPPVPAPPPAPAPAPVPIHRTGRQPTRRHRIDESPLRQRVRRERCPSGTRRNRRTGNCEPTRRRGPRPAVPAAPATPPVAAAQVNRVVNGYEIRPNEHLERANLQGADLQGARLEGAHLDDADLRGAHLERAVLEGAVLTLANLRDVHLEGANLRRAVLQGTILQGAHLERAVLEGSDLRFADLRGAHLEGADLRGAFLRGVSLRGADLRGTDLRGADLRGADFRGAILQGADFRDAILQDADLQGPLPQAQADSQAQRLGQQPIQQPVVEIPYNTNGVVEAYDAYMAGNSPINDPDVLDDPNIIVFYIANASGIVINAVLGYRDRINTEYREKTSHIYKCKHADTAFAFFSNQIFMQDPFYSLALVQNHVIRLQFIEDILRTNNKFWLLRLSPEPPITSAINRKHIRQNANPDYNIDGKQVSVVSGYHCQVNESYLKAHEDPRNPKRIITDPINGDQLIYIWVPTPIRPSSI
jgi:uncharacterized protein YjbI with pentapeptide repeats